MNKAFTAKQKEYLLARNIKALNELNKSMYKAREQARQAKEQAREQRREHRQIQRANAYCQSLEV